MIMARGLAFLVLSATAACASSAGNACPSPLVVEVDTSHQRGVWDTTAAVQLMSAVGDCLRVHQEKNKFEDSTTWYRIPITATLMGSYESQYSEYLNASRPLSGRLRVEAMSRNGVVLRSDTIPYVFTASTKEWRVSGSLNGLTPDEAKHVAQVRVGLLLK